MCVGWGGKCRWWILTLNLLISTGSINHEPDHANGWHQVNTLHRHHPSLALPTRVCAEQLTEYCPIGQSDKGLRIFTFSSLSLFP